MDAIPYVLVAIIALFIFVQLAFRLSTRRLEGKSAPDVSDLLDPPPEPGEKALFYFYSNHCPPCRKMTPRVDRLSQRFPNVIKINISESRELGQRFSITATPSIIVVDQGQITRALVGTHSEKHLASYLEADAARVAGN